MILLEPDWLFINLCTFWNIRTNWILLSVRMRPIVKIKPKPKQTKMQLNQDKTTKVLCLGLILIVTTYEQWTNVKIAISVTIIETKTEMRLFGIIISFLIRYLGPNIINCIELKGKNIDCTSLSTVMFVTGLIGPVIISNYSHYFNKTVGFNRTSNTTYLPIDFINVNYMKLIMLNKHLKNTWHLDRLQDRKFLCVNNK